MDLISVIVPVFKVEPYLDQCVESIVKQLYSNLEIILVDDGSPDHCPEICDAWAEKDKRIRVIHKENGGLSDARNVGLAEATGEFIAFVDSDDWIDAKMLFILHRCILDTRSDIASCGAVRVWEDGKKQQAMISAKGNQVLDKVSAMRALIQSTFLIQTVWNKLYKADLIKGIPFEVGKIHEDEFWSWQVVAAANRVATVVDNLYYYRQRQNSIMGNYYTGKPMLVIEAKYLRHLYIKNRLPELESIDSEDLLYTCYYQGCQIVRFEDQNKRREYFSEIKKIANNCEIELSHRRELRMTKRIRLFLIKHWTKGICTFDVRLGLN